MSSDTVAGDTGGQETGSGITVNGSSHETGGVTGSLLFFLRDRLGLTSVKPGCGEGACGACTVLLDGEPVLACQVPVTDAAGRSVRTAEGLAAGRPHLVRQAFAAERASQCGYCTPGMTLRAVALLAAHPDPDETRIAEALDPSLCRCGCQPRIVRAVRRAAAIARGDEPPAPARTPAPALSFARPARPWDLTDPSERHWFDLLGDGLVVVWSPPVPGGARSARGSRGRQVAAWLHVSSSGIVTAFTGKVDIGQDNKTALRLLVAEELGVPLENVRVVQGDTDVCPWDPGTFGSRSMPDAGESLRRAAAGARQILIRRAAVGWEADPATLTIRDGVVSGGQAGTSAACGELVAGLRQVEVLTAEPPLKEPARWELAGHGGHYADRDDAVTGARGFVSDLTLPGMLYGAVLRPPAPGATLRGLDGRAAQAMPGVRVVRDGAFAGVTAPDLMTARRAVAALAAEWDQVPSSPTGTEETAAYLRAHPVAAQGWGGAVDEAQGEPEAALSRAAVTLRATYIAPYIAHVPLETRCAIALWEADDRLTVWSGCNTPFPLRGQLAEAFGIPDEDVRVLVPHTGGGFGGKHGEEGLEAARLARAAGAAVKVHWSRAEEFRAGYVRPMAVMDVAAGLSADGTLLVWDFLDVNAGANGFAFPYKTAHRRLRYAPAATLLPQGPYRALSATANTFARESAIDELAHLAGADPVEFRLRVLDDERLAAVLRAAASRFGWPGTGEGIAGGIDAATGSGAGPGASAGRGAGVAIGLEKGGRVATCAEAVVTADGDVRVSRIVTAYECGAIVNPDTVTAQVEGGTVMALGGALFEQLTLDHGRLASDRLSDYRVPRFSDIPPIEVALVDRPDLPPAGAGETPLIAVAPAIAGAIFAATGRRLRSLPLTPVPVLTPAPAPTPR